MELNSSRNNYPRSPSCEVLKVSQWLNQLLYFISCITTSYPLGIFVFESNLNLTRRIFVPIRFQGAIFATQYRELCLRAISRTNFTRSLASSFCERDQGRFLPVATRMFFMSVVENLRFEYIKYQPCVLRFLSG